MKLRRLSLYNSKIEYCITIEEVANHTPTRKSGNSNQNQQHYGISEQNNYITKEPETGYQNYNLPSMIERAHRNNNVKKTCTCEIS
jgi:hypothetical protein